MEKLLLSRGTCFVDGFEYLFRCHGERFDHDSYGVVDGVGYGGRGGDLDSLAGFLGSEGAHGVDGFHGFRLDVRHIRGGGQLVLEEGGVDGLAAVFLLDLVFQEGLAEAAAD